MLQRTRLWRWFLGAACVALLAAAILHAAGFSRVKDALAGSTLAAEWAAGMRALWLGFALHLTGLAALVVLASVRPSSAGRSVLVTCGVILGLDTLVLLAGVGISLLDVLTALAAFLIFAAVFVRPPRGAAQDS